MKITLGRNAKKQLDRLNEPMLSRIVKALKELDKDPPKGDIKNLKNETHKYRLRVGNYRLLFDIFENEIFVGDSTLRGQAYKNRRGK
jgi:mRNA interferase RelE/StbE